MEMKLILPLDFVFRSLKIPEEILTRSFTLCFPVRIKTYNKATDVCFIRNKMVPSYNIISLTSIYTYIYTASIRRTFA